jgi:hypothetical protein
MGNSRNKRQSQLAARRKRREERLRERVKVAKQAAASSRSKKR